MVTKYGMDAKVGQRTYAPRPQTFLPATQDAVVSAAEATGREIDLAVRDLIEAGVTPAPAPSSRSAASDLDAGVALLIAKGDADRGGICAVAPGGGAAEGPPSKGLLSAAVRRLMPIKRAEAGRGRRLPDRNCRACRSRRHGISGVERRPFRRGEAICRTPRGDGRAQYRRARRARRTRPRRHAKGAARAVPAEKPSRIRLRGFAASDRRGADDFAALYRRLHGGSPDAARAARRFSRSARVPAMPPPCCRGSRPVSTRSNVSASSPKRQRRRLADLGYDNVHVLHGDGTKGWPEHAPYDAIVVAAGGPQVPESLKEQLKIGGRLVIPVGADQRTQELVRVVTRFEGRISQRGYRRRSLRPADRRGGMGGAEGQGPRAGAPGAAAG